uniref:ARAD1D38434p n=1 Tax=Blastobotrys adeninivorans TaxID=409370 RepID=A0A060TCC6_BLAAD
MDNLSSLGSGLPKKKRTDVDGAIVSEFKAAATAVTKLFKLSGEKAVVASDRGYLRALEDVLDALQDPQVNIEQWIKERKQEIEQELDNYEEYDNSNHNQHQHAKDLDDSDDDDDDNRDNRALKRRRLWADRGIDCRIGR